MQRNAALHIPNGLHAAQPPVSSFTPPLSAIKLPARPPERGEGARSDKNAKPKKGPCPSDKNAKPKKRPCPAKPKSGCAARSLHGGAFFAGGGEGLAEGIGGGIFQKGLKTGQGCFKIGDSVEEGGFVCDKQFRPERSVYHGDTG